MKTKAVDRKTQTSKDVTKFKLRSGRYLYTLALTSKEKADKVKQSLPPGLTKIEV